jgi:hypothetical protein
VYMTSFPYVEQILVEASITGLIHVTSDPAGGGPWVNADFDYKGVWDAGMYQCDWSALITTPQATVPLGACSPSGYTQVSEWRDTILLGGIGGNEVVNARRGGGPGAPQYCPNGNLCHVATGTQTVTVTPLAADIDLRGFYGAQAGRTIFVPAFTHSQGYQTVAFVDSANAKSAKGIPMPIRGVSWAWRKTDPNAVPDSYWHSTDIASQCPTSPTYASIGCSLNVKESGVLTSVARVNGLQHADSVCVQCSVIDPQAGLPDSILNLQAVRTAMLQMADSSNGHDSNPDLRREQVAVVLRDTTDGRLLVVTHLQDSSSQCLSHWRPLTPDFTQGMTVIAYVHTHPIVNGERIRCDSTHFTTRNTAPSDSDVVMRRRVNQISDSLGVHRPDWYVMSMDGLFKMDDTNSSKAQHSITEWYHGLCAWARFDDRNAAITRRTW